MLYVAIHFHEKGLYKTDHPTAPGSNRKQKVRGYQVSETNYKLLKLLLPHQVADIPRSRIIHYRYITLTEVVQQRHNFFIFPIQESILPQIEAITTSELNPLAYLWRDDQWWSFPQLETYETGEVNTFIVTRGDLFGNIDQADERQIKQTKRRVRTTYVLSKGPGFDLTHDNVSGEVNPAGFPISIIGNGMILEWKRGYDNKPECWWLRDEKSAPKQESRTYQHYALLKATPQARWSRNFHAWYYTGGSSPPQAWLTLVGYASAAIDTQSETHAYDDGLELVPNWLIEMMQSSVQPQSPSRSEERMIYAKLFAPDADWYLFIHKYSPRYREVYCYGILNSDIEMAEWGWQSIKTLQEVRGRMGLPMERDTSFKPKLLKDALREWKHARGYPVAEDELPNINSPFPPEISQQIEDILAADEGHALELMPMTLIDANYGKYEWNYGNPDVWCKLINQREAWMFFVANVSLTERGLYGYKLHLSANTAVFGEWGHLAIPDLDQATTRRDPHFTRQPLRTAIEQVAQTSGNFLPDDLGVPTEAECRQRAFQAQQKERERIATYAARKERAAAMQAYHEFQAVQQLQQRFAEHLHHLTTRKALPAISTPPLDDPWS